MQIKLRSLSFLIMLTFLFLSCTPTEDYTTEADPSIPSSTSETYIQIPTIIPTSTIHPTPSPISSDQIIQAYFNVTQGNTCELPCFLGITPGQTKWEDTKNIFIPYAISIKDGIFLSDERSLMPYFIELAVPKLNVQMKYYADIESEKILYIDMNNSTPLSEYLSLLGLPNQVLISSAGMSGSRMGKDFTLAVAYFRQGVIALLDGEFQIVEQKATICSEQLKNIQMLALWSIEDIRFIGDLIRLDGYTSIESISDTTIEEFYNQYSKENTNYCFTLNY